MDTNRVGRRVKFISFKLHDKKIKKWTLIKTLRASEDDFMVHSVTPLAILYMWSRRATSSLFNYVMQHNQIL